MLEKYYLNTLSGDAYNAYYAIDSAVRSYRSDCMLYGIGTEEADLVVKCYMYDNPDVWHCNLYLVRVGSEASGTRVFFNYNDYNASDFNDKLRQITDYVDSHTDNYSSDYDIVKTVYDYFTKNMRANDDAQCAFGRLDTSNDGAIGEFVEKYGYCFSAYGAIVKREAVCMGFSAAFKLVLDRYRVDTMCVPGMVENIPHMMNAVEIDGERSFVDVSRGLCRDDFKMTMYDYFMVGDDRVSKYFTWDEQLGCITSRNNYFLKNGLYFQEGYKLRKYLNSVSFRRVGGEIRFFYAGKGFDDDRLEKMIGDIFSVRCGTEYEIVGYTAEYGIGNCLLKKREE
jgi:hypothetical protein